VAPGAEETANRKRTDRFDGTPDFSRSREGADQQHPLPTDRDSSPTGVRQVQPSRITLAISEAISEIVLSAVRSATLSASDGLY
jgi:hypothetical protein